jgi:NADH-quinone oxidoreductase subunit A
VTPFAPVAVLGAVVLGFGLLVIALTFVIGPRKPNPVKESVYESGVVPWAVGFREMARPAPAGLGMATLAEMASFLGVLFLGLVYVWRKGALDWGAAEEGAL